MPYSSELEFERDLIKILTTKGWEKKVLKNYSEKQLIDNWADILFENNRGINGLNDVPLSEGEMMQIMEEITDLRTPLRLNEFINGRFITIKRDNKDDKQNFGKEVQLKIYDPKEIAAGQSRYQIVEQPKFPTPSSLMNDRRGDLMLLINGMPVIHIELKSSNVSVDAACQQIKKYAHEHVFTGLFSLIQVFVAMNPEEALYFANPGPDGNFNPCFFFHWADFNNNPINKWNEFASSLLSIPMAHQLIGFYTIADKTDGVLKVMRSYQFYASNGISDKVAKTEWEKDNQLGGYIWHTTGSGKTMTSFKSAQLIASSKDADKVVFLVDRIELGTQSYNEYNGFANADESVQRTENTGVLIAKLKSENPSDILIVTSIQKMSNINDDEECSISARELEMINSKRIVFIIDECHRSTFGEMLYTIKKTFPRAIFFGFTGTPIQLENQKKMNTTTTVFGNELHRYSIADGIRDKNVLGFDPYKVLTFKDSDLRTSVALEKAKADTVEEAMKDPKKMEIFYKYYDLDMAGSIGDDGKYKKGIEDYIPDSQYESPVHQNMVVKDILDNWLTLSRGGKFHAIFATSSIKEAIEYYRLFKKVKPELKVTALFDPNIDNTGGTIYKEEGLIEIIEDYYKRYGVQYTIPKFQLMKKDIANRLAHKNAHKFISKTPEMQINLLIVVDQMLTGFDSKWVNTLYLDKMLEYENIIQAFSRTNRLFGEEKKFGIIKYYRRPHTMEKNIEKAVKLYSGDKPFGLFVDKLYKNLENMNSYFQSIKALFESAGIPDFSKLPEDKAERKEFSKLFRAFCNYLDAALIQGFEWKKNEYVCTNESTGGKERIAIEIDETTYKILLLRYKELQSSRIGGDGGDEEVPYDIDGYITSIDTDDINSDYMNSRFERYVKILFSDEENMEDLKKAEDELHSTFATLSQEDQKFANIFLHDIQSGDVKPEKGKGLRDYITEYKTKCQNDRIHKFAYTFGLDEDQLRNIMLLPHSTNISEFGRYKDLRATVVKEKAMKYFTKKEGKRLIPPKVNIMMDNLLRKFIEENGFDLDEDSTEVK